MNAFTTGKKGHRCTACGVGCIDVAVVDGRVPAAPRRGTTSVMFPGDDDLALRLFATAVGHPTSSRWFDRPDSFLAPDVIAIFVAAGGPPVDDHPDRFPMAGLGTGVQFDQAATDATARKTTSDDAGFAGNRGLSISVARRRRRLNRYGADACGAACAQGVPPAGRRGLSAACSTRPPPTRSTVNCVTVGLDPVTGVAGWWAVEPGSAADWVAAVAALIAAFGTVGALIYQARALNEERATRWAEDQRLRAEQFLAREAQANAIVLHDVVLVGNPQRGLTGFRVTIGNYGETPIKEVAGHLSRVDGADVDQVIRVPVLDAGAATSLIWDLHGESTWWPGSQRETYALAATFSPRATFKDVHDEFWTVVYKRPVAQQVKTEDPDAGPATG